jgi:hypothetical protein
MRRLLDWLLYARTGGQFRHLVGLTAHYAPPDLAAYRHYLPQPLGLPAQPVVKVFLIDYREVSPWPLRPYQEWSVLLRAVLDGVEGWFPVTMPVTTWVARQGGHHLGFPKYVTPTIGLVETADGARGHAIAPGRMEVTMDFRYGTPPAAAGVERRLLEAESILPDDLLVLKPVGKGPTVNRVRFVDAVPSRWESAPGVITIHGDAGGLIPQGIPLPASLHRYRGGMNLVAVTARVA